MCVPCIVKYQKMNEVPAYLDSFIDWFVSNRVVLSDKEKLLAVQRELATLKAALMKAGIEVKL